MGGSVPGQRESVSKAKLFLPDSHMEVDQEVVPDLRADDLEVD